MSYSSIVAATGLEPVSKAYETFEFTITPNRNSCWLRKSRTFIAAFVAQCSDPLNYKPISGVKAGLEPCSTDSQSVALPDKLQSPFVFNIHCPVNSKHNRSFEKALRCISRGRFSPPFPASNIFCLRYCPMLLFVTLCRRMNTYRIASTINKNFIILLFKSV